MAKQLWVRVSVFHNGILAEIEGLQYCKTTDNLKWDVYCGENSSATIPHNTTFPFTEKCNVNSIEIITVYENINRSGN